MRIRLAIVIILIAIITGFGIFISRSDKPLDKSVTIDKIVVAKSKRKMYVYSNGEQIKTYNISLGRKPTGDKEFEGDKKTPEGTYFINAKNPYSGFHKNLGISYPDIKDIEESKRIGKNSGGQIKIHGLINKYSRIGRLHLVTDWTNGCIAVTNKEIDELYGAVKIGTPIEIIK